MRHSLLVLIGALAACGQPSRPQFPVPIAANTAATPPQRTETQPAQAARPAWRPVKVVADAAEVAAQQVTVAAGDTLSEIGERTGSSVQAIAQANRLKPPYTIEIGQLLDVPAGRYHTVKAGETGIAIARAYGADWRRVVEVNALAAPYMLRVGQRLRLPTAAAAREMTLAERAAAFRIDIDDLITGSEPAIAAASTPAQASAAPLAAPPPFDGRFIVPVAGRVVSRFGVKDGGLYNDGINIRATAGTAIRAAASGVVAYAGDGIGGFGNLVLIKHAAGWVTAYAHADDMLVVRGDMVRQGDTIARVGRSGSVDEPQLHFEIRQGRRPVDPARHLPAFG